MPASSAMSLERARARHDFERVGHRVGMLVRGEALAHDLLHGGAPLGRERGEVVGVDEPLHPALAQPLRQGVPLVEVRVVERRRWGRRTA